VQVETASGQAGTTGCAELLKALPATVMGQGHRTVSPVSALAAAWGNPAIVLRCGVPTPAMLQPTSRCDVVNGVGWFSREDADHNWVFTTIGRTSKVELRVPGNYSPAADALIDVAAAIKDNIEVKRPCV
jgi:hypothetical protein